MGKIFISYSHKDDAWMKRLTTQLKVLEMEDICSVWVDTKIETGTDWEPEINRALDDAHIIVMLISAYFLVSKFIRGVEVPRAMERREKDGVRVIPLLVKSCPWKKVEWLSKMQMAPRGAQPLAGMQEHEADDVLAKLAERIAEMLIAEPPPGDAGPKPPKDQRISIAMPITGSKLFGREKELKLLDEAWADADQHIVTFIAWGGVGKTALVNRWLANMEQQNFRGARRVYGWSFYSQGAEEGKQASADSFLQQTLEWFGDPDPKAGDGTSKGRRLAERVGKQKTLLILDGLEPLQYPKGKDKKMTGQLKDKGLCMFLQQLSWSMDGLCIVTSRETVKDLEGRRDHTVTAMPLEHLEDGAGAALLKHLGVTGAENEIMETVAEYGGHALALTLLGNYAATVFDGDIRKRDKIPGLTAEEEQGGHARRVMAAHEERLGDSAERNILSIMGLFDRPVDPGALDALKAKRKIKGVTDRLRNISEPKWKYALKHLRGAGLLAAEDPAGPGGLDGHPLVREHFGERLRKENPKGWTEANKRLYHYYKDLPDKDEPDTLEEMEPLFAAVAHGCRAGMQQEALDDVYYSRIQRNGDTNYCCKMLGAFGADLAALSHFFETPWSKVADGLVEPAKAAILNWAAFGLRAVGRLREAKEPMKAALDAHVEQENWVESAKDASNLSELLLTLGEVAEAVRMGRESVRRADQSGDWQMKIASRTALADALLHGGDGEEAEKWFREAEALQQEHQPQYQYLYSLRGYRFCDRLLDRGETGEVLERMSKLYEWRQPSDPLLDVSLEGLMTGRAQLTPPESDPAAMPYLDRAVTGLREAGDQEFLAKGLFARAAGRRLLGEFDTARQDLEEALEIITLGDMKLHRVDYLLEMGRLAEAEGEKDNARKYYEEAGILIEETGYKRREVPKVP